MNYMRNIATRGIKWEEDAPHGGRRCGGRRLQQGRRRCRHLTSGRWLGVKHKVGWRKE